MKTALLLVDLQKDYFPGGRMPLENPEEAVTNAARALSLFRDKGWPVCHIRHVSIHPGATFFLPGTPGLDFHPQVAPIHGEAVIEKNFPNSFRDTTLREDLKHMGVGALVIAGMMSHMCVDATTRAAFDLGYQCQVLPEACATLGLDFKGLTIPAAQVHGAFMAALGLVYAKLTLTDDLDGALAPSQG